MRARCGHEPASGLYFEALGDGDVPWLFIHGGGATGASWRVTPDGRPGWADVLAAAGEECWVTDWPGGGRSGGCDPLAVTYDDLVAGYVSLLRDVIARPAIVVCHSMGGALTWKLVEQARPLVLAVAAIGASYPGNIAPVSEVLEDDGTTLRVCFAATGVEFVVRRDRLYRYDDAYVYDQALATSTRFPRDRVDVFRASLVGIPPRVLLQRLGLDGGLPRVERTDAFAGLRVRLVAGTEDPAHTRAIDTRTIELLRFWNADAELVFLGDRGIDGNGHFLFHESNSDEILELVRSEIEA